MGAISTRDFLNQLSADQLDFAIQYAGERLQKLNDVPKQEYWRVGDDWINVAFFNITEREKALECFVKEFETDHSYTELRIEVVKLRPDDVKGLLK